MPKTQHTQRAASYGRIRQVKRRARLYPHRPQYDLRKAAGRLGLRLVGCEIEFFNPFSTGKAGNVSGAPQWVDVMVKHRTLGLLALDIEEDDYRYTPRTREEKRKGLAARHIPYFSSPPAGLWMLEARLARWIHELERQTNE